MWEKLKICKSGFYSPVVIGFSMVDTHFFAHEPKIELNGAFYNAEIKTFAGGVGRNIAESIFKIYGDVSLISVVGDDKIGSILKSSLPKKCLVGMKTIPNCQTATCAVLLDKTGTCRLVAGNLSSAEQITPQLILDQKSKLKKAPIIVFDANVPLNAMAKLLKMAEKYKKPVLFEPTDVFVATKPFSLAQSLIRNIKFITPNLEELRVIAKFFNIKSDLKMSPNDSELELEEIVKITEKLHNFIDNIIVTMGVRGVFISRLNSNDSFFNKLSKEPEKTERPRVMRFYPVKIQEKVANTSGAGDAFCAGFVSAMIKNLPEAICISVGMQAARESLKALGATPEFYFDKNHPCWTTPADYVELNDYND